MQITRIIALGVIVASAGLTALNAQTLREAAPPAEFPPTSFKGKQYVDSRGCIYIRAGIDGNVTWVPRVGRDRKQVCGYKPTLAAGTGTATAPKPTSGKPPTVITVPATAAPATPKPTTKPATTTTTVAPTTRQPTTTTTTRAPAATTATTTTTRRPATTTTVTTAPAPKPAPTPTPTPAPATAAPAAAPESGGCPNASAFSQRFINKKGVRCGPQAEPPITYGPGTDRSSSLNVPVDTRVVPRHVYDRRQNTTNVEVPSGYRTVWTDDRLNPNRAERTLRPAAIQEGVVKVPSGYKLVERRDGRLNANRGVKTAAGDAQTDQLWSQTVPRTLNPVPTRGQIVTVSSRDATAQAAAQPTTTVTRLSTRSAPASQAQAAPEGRRRYVRVATYATDDDARSTAQALARTGLPMRLGTVQRGGTPYRVVLAGPFTSKKQARAALDQVRGAGFTDARLSK